MNAHSFGTDDHREEFATKYGSADYQAVGRAIADAQHAAPAAPQVPNTPASLIRLASDKAVQYLVDLAKLKTPAVAEDAIRAWAGSVDKALVSEKIDWLKIQPLAAAQIPVPVADIPEGRYAVTGEQGQTVFVKVDRPTEGQYKGRTFVKVQAGSEYHKIAWPVAKAILAKIEHDGPKAASIRYGKELGVCGVCGRTLTNEESRAAGIGPKCAQGF
jgi:hypothetical protein